MKTISSCEYYIIYFQISLQYTHFYNKKNNKLLHQQFEFLTLL